jgi:hypothetical protein
LEREQCDQFLTCVATRCHQDASLVELLDLVLVALTESGLLELLVKGSGEFVERNPAASVVLPNRLTELLDDLANRSMSLRETVAALRVGGTLLGDRSEELAGWEELVVALDNFDSAGNRRWTIWDRFVESGAVRRVNKAGRRLAERTTGTDHATTIRNLRGIGCRIGLHRISQPSIPGRSSGCRRNWQPGCRVLVGRLLDRTLPSDLQTAVTTATREVPMPAA